MEREMDIPPATGEGRRRPPGRSPDDDDDDEAAATAAEEGDEDQPIGDERISSSSPASLPCC
jgi:hypothetical protein